MEPLLFSPDPDEDPESPDPDESEQFGLYPVALAQSSLEAVSPVVPEEDPDEPEQFGLYPVIFAQSTVVPAPSPESLLVPLSLLADWQLSRRRSRGVIPELEEELLESEDGLLEFEEELLEPEELLESEYELLDLRRSRSN